MESKIPEKPVSERTRMERLLFPLRGMLLLNVLDPLQWVYVEPLMRALNRSTVALCHFNPRERGLQAPWGIHVVTFRDAEAAFGDDAPQPDAEELSFKVRAALYLDVLQPAGLVLLGSGERERTLSELARERGLRVVYVRQGCAPETAFFACNRELPWTNVGCLLPVSSDDKRNILAVCFRNRSREERSRVQRELVEELRRELPATQFGVVQPDGDLVATEDDLRLRALPRVRLFPATAWKELLSRGRVVVSDDTDLLSQAALSGCRPLRYDWDTSSCALWKCPLNGLQLPAWGDDAARKAARQCNFELPYRADELACGRLHLGCGSNFLEGWLNTDVRDGADVRFLNAGKLYPFFDATFDYVFSEHLFEHLSVEEGMTMLHECFRVLRPGGRLRLTLPDFDFLIRLYQHPEEEQHKAYIRWSIGHFDGAVRRIYGEEDVPAMFVVNNFIREWGHRMVYNRAVLTDLLTRVGFKHVEACQQGESSCPDLRGVEHHDRTIPAQFNRLESMTLEATK